MFKPGGISALVTGFQVLNDFGTQGFDRSTSDTDEKRTLVAFGMLGISARQ